MSQPLSHRFLSFLSADLSEEVAEHEVQVALETNIREARHAWPTIVVADEDFVEYLAERVVDTPIPQALLQLRASDLYLACACAGGDEHALALFSQSYANDFGAILASMRISQATIDDVKQQVSQKLFVAAEGELPRIRDYAGEGDLRTWTRVIAVRMALTQLRKSKQEVELDDAMLSLQSPDDDPELFLIKKRYRSEFRTSFHNAVTILNARERTLLRMHLLDGLTIDRIGGVYGVHRATAFRWIAKAREKVWAETQRLVQLKLQLSVSEYGRVLEQVRSQLDLSIERALCATHSKAK